MCTLISIVKCTNNRIRWLLCLHTAENCYIVVCSYIYLQQLIVSYLKKRFVGFNID